jgi:hypothetical protein
MRRPTKKIRVGGNKVESSATSSFGVRRLNEDHWSKFLSAGCCRCRSLLRSAEKAMSEIIKPDLEPKGVEGEKNL